MNNQIVTGSQHDVRIISSRPVVKARKVYECFKCERAIEMSESYFYQYVQTYDLDKPVQIRFCNNCRRDGHEYDADSGRQPTGHCQQNGAIARSIIYECESYHPIR